MPDRPSITRSRRAVYSRPASATKSCGPFSAAMAAAWATEQGLDVLCDWILAITLIRPAGPAA